MQNNEIINILKELNPCVFNYNWEKDKQTFGFLAQDIEKYFSSEKYSLVKFNKDFKTETTPDRNVLCWLYSIYSITSGLYKIFT